jgi:hypothetical protein
MPELAPVMTVTIFLRSRRMTSNGIFSPRFLESLL